MDNRTQAKKSVLEEIIKMMDDRMDNGLKSKSPKFMKINIESKDPLDAEEESSEDPMEALKEKLMGKDGESEEETPKHSIVAPGQELSEDDESDEDKQRLLELYSKLK